MGLVVLIYICIILSENCLLYRRLQLLQHRENVQWYQWLWNESWRFFWYSPLPAIETHGVWQVAG